MLNISNEWLLIASITSLLVLTGIIITVAYKLLRHHRQQQQQLQTVTQELLLSQDRLQQLINQKDSIQKMLNQEQQAQYQLRQQFDQHQIKSLTVIQDSLQKSTHNVQQQVTQALKQHGDFLGQRIDHLTGETKSRLKQISDEVDRQLQKGFEKTTATFTDVVKRLTIIDEAQKRISELSSNVVSLNEILVDRRSRGTFGEVQLSTLLHNVMPESHFSLQHTLSNGKRVDCLLRLPPPSGDIAIDAKFPLETFKLLQNKKLSDTERRQTERRFRLDIRHHIDDIAQKYIINEETADSAIMFIPAEAIFAEIHANYPDLVEAAQNARVWLVSPTTMMAVLTTARAVIKDAATRKQVHIIQKHLVALSKDFDRFQQRMNKLAQHVNQAHKDVELVHMSSQKISTRFSKIEQVELPQEEQTLTDNA